MRYVNWGVFVCVHVNRTRAYISCIHVVKKPLENGQLSTRNKLFVNDAIHNHFSGDVAAPRD